jgi:peptide/nickel transport system substrate-binding protein
MPPSYNGWCLPYDEWSADLKAQYSYDPDTAKQLLADAGYPDGFDTNIVISSTQDSTLFQIIKAYFSDIGVNMEIDVMDQATWNSYCRAKKHDQMYGANWSAKPDPPQVRVADLVTGNPSGNNDPDYDALNDKFRASSSEDEAKATAREADLYVLEHHWGVVVCPTAVFMIWQPYLKGCSGDDITQGQNWSLPRLWIDQELKDSLDR